MERVLGVGDLERENEREGKVLMGELIERSWSLNWPFNELIDSKRVAFYLMFIHLGCRNERQGPLAGPVTIKAAVTVAFRKAPESVTQMHAD